MNKIDMNDIEKALREEDFCQSMADLGFNLRNYDEDYPNHYYFVKNDKSLIIFYSAIDGEFTTYPRANHRKLTPSEAKEKMSGGIRRTCGKCFSSNYDVKLQYCRKCGWKANKQQTQLTPSEKPE